MALTFSGHLKYYFLYLRKIVHFNVLTFICFRCDVGLFLKWRYVTVGCNNRMLSNVTENVAVVVLFHIIPKEISFTQVTHISCIQYHAKCHVLY